jgi:site-specific DNA-methyltransferase (adenine-specific)
VITLLNMDCMTYMATLPDKAFDLAIVDPPYGVKRDKGFARKQYKGDWDSATPESEYFDELQRISKNQIIWGGNFFTDKLPQNNHWIFWDKKNTMPTFGDGELAWSSIDKNSVKQITLEYNGLLGKELDRIHPTQKPVKLYEWLLTNYAKTGQRILDTHLGSGSSAIAAHNLGFEFVGMELDKDYFNAAQKRFNAHTAQSRMFGDVYDQVERVDFEQASLL